MNKVRTVALSTGAALIGAAYTIGVTTLICKSPGIYKKGIALLGGIAGIPVMAWATAEGLNDFADSIDRFVQKRKLHKELKNLNNN